MRIALTIAGSDSGGAAGIQADLKTFHQFGVFGTTAITAVTAQNTLGVAPWQAVPAALVAQQIDALATDLGPAAVKSGLLGSGESVETLAQRPDSHIRASTRQPRTAPAARSPPRSPRASPSAGHSSGL